MEKITYELRNTANNEPIRSFNNVNEAVAVARGFNSKYNADKCYIVKVVTTISVEAVTF